MSNIYDKASLVLIPSGTKTSKVYSQKPTNGDGDFTFSRSTAATRVNASGNIEKETQNLLLQSNQFDTTWSNNGTTETSGQSGYDGSSDAWLLEKSIAGGSIRQSIVFNGVGTYSVYAKAGTLNYILLYINYGSGTDTQAYFDLSNGSVGTTIAEIDANIESVGNGWYRCSVSFSTPSATATTLFFPAQGDGDTSGTSGSIYIQDAQLEQGLVARDYIETTTAAVYGGITDNTPRLDYTDSSCPSLKLEPQRTNSINISEYFGSNGQGGGAGFVITDNYTESPEGYNNAARIQYTSGNTYMVANSINMSIGEVVTMSIYAKGTAGEQFRLYCDGSSGATINTEFTLTSDWVRYETTSSAATANGVLTPHILVGYGSSNPADDFQVYGWQGEKGSYPTSYIPTYGSAVTRGKDDCTLSDVSNVIADSKGSFYIEGNLSTIDTSGVIALTAGANTEDLFYIFITTAGVLLCEWFDGGTLQARLQAPAGSISVGDSFKIAAAYQDNDFVAYWNGTQIGTDSSGTAPTPTLLRIGKYNVDNYTGGSYTNVMVFPTRLSNEELAALTTI